LSPKRVPLWLIVQISPPATMGGPPAPVGVFHSTPKAGGAALV